MLVTLLFGLPSFAIAYLALRPSPTFARTIVVGLVITIAWGIVAGALMGAFSPGDNKVNQGTLNLAMLGGALGVIMAASALRGTRNWPKAQTSAVPAAFPPPGWERQARMFLSAGAAAVAIVAATVILYAIGFFNRGPATGSIAPPTAARPFTTATTDIARTAATRSSDDELPIRSTHGDWQIRCDTPVGANREQCVLMQVVTAEDRDNTGLTVIVLKTPDKRSRIMRILAPLGVLLPSGLSLKIESTDMGRAEFVRCVPNGCVAEVILDDRLLAQLSGGKMATFIILQTLEDAIGIPISLTGFRDGFAALR